MTSKNELNKYYFNFTRVVQIWPYSTIGYQRSKCKIEKLLLLREPSLQVLHGQVKSFLKAYYNYKSTTDVHTHADVLIHIYTI